MIHTDLPIYRTGVQLMQLAVQVQVQLPREVKRHLGDKISAHCMSMLDEMALAYAITRGLVAPSEGTPWLVRIVTRP